MNALTPVPAQRRKGAERPVVISWVSVLVALCWAYLLFRASHLGGADATAGLAPLGRDPPPPAPYRPDELVLLFGMWVAMMWATMLPSATPAVVLFARVNRLYHAVRRPYLATALFMLGYLLAWAMFSVPSTMVQWALHDAGALDSAMAVTNSTVAGLTLVRPGCTNGRRPSRTACIIAARRWRLY
jgi:predicted metal-binding membrane protein